MKKFLLLAFVVFTAALSFGQCDKDPAGGTACVAPLKTKVAQGQSTTFTFDMTPASINAPCIKLVAGSPLYRLCGQSNQITVDFGDGKGFVPLQGPQGQQGLAGPQGPAGPTGATGPTGGIGPKGDTGPAGVDGKDGAQGPQGVQGAQGIPGQDGIGQTGAQGPAGPPGPQGAVGPAGAQGVPGPSGQQGQQGPQGVQGPMGPAGTYPTSFTLTCGPTSGSVPKGFKAKCSISVP